MPRGASKSVDFTPAVNDDLARLKPRKKLSFKEPEIFSYLKLKRPFARAAKPALAAAATQPDVTLDEKLVEESCCEDIDELEVHTHNRVLLKWIIIFPSVYNNKMTLMTYQLHQLWMLQS